MGALAALPIPTTTTTTVGRAGGMTAVFFFLVSSLLFPASSAARQEAPRGRWDAFPPPVLGQWRAAAGMGGASRVTRWGATCKRSGAPAHQLGKATGLSLECFLFCRRYLVLFQRYFYVAGGLSYSTQIHGQLFLTCPLDPLALLRRPARDQPWSRCPLRARPHPRCSPLWTLLPLALLSRRCPVTCPFQCYTLTCPLLLSLALLLVLSPPPSWS